MLPHERGDLRGDRAQLRQEPVAHLIAGGARGVGLQVERADRTTATAIERRPRSSSSSTMEKP
jgi:hypothetical protein